MMAANSSDNGKKSKQKQKDTWDSWIVLLVVCIIVPLLLRSVFYAPFNIPSGSMKSTLLVGDYIFVSKFAYGYSSYSFPLGYGLHYFDGRKFWTPPKRGDVIVFRPPATPHIDYIKRLIGLPGDRVRMLKGRLYINGNLVPQRRIEDFVEEVPFGKTMVVKRIRQYIETLPNGVSYTVLDERDDDPLDTTHEYVIPEGHYFFLGDNRDNSADSRTDKAGIVPEENLIGRAELIFFSVDGPMWKIWEWFDTLRGDRFLKPIR